MGTLHLWLFSHCLCGANLWQRWVAVKEKKGGFILSVSCRTQCIIIVFFFEPGSVSWVIIFCCIFLYDNILLLHSDKKIKPSYKIISSLNGMNAFISSNHSMNIGSTLSTQPNPSFFSPQMLPHWALMDPSMCECSQTRSLTPRLKTSHSGSVPVGQMAFSWPPHPPSPLTGWSWHYRQANSDLLSNWETKTRWDVTHVL